MKNILRLSMVGLVMLSSCKKEHNNNVVNTSDKKYQITFNLNNEEQLSATNKLKVNAATPINSHVLKHLLYSVYSGSTVVHSITQDSTASNYGSITDALSPGTYSIVFLASKLPIQVDQGEFVYLPILFDDFFYKKFDITVNGSNINQPVTLGRVAGKLQIVIQDTIPADVTSINVSYQDEKRFSVFSGFSPNQIASTTFSTNLKPIDAGKPNYTFGNLVYNFFNTLAVTITPVSKTKQWPSVTVPNVYVRRNQVTVLSGGLFSPTKHNAGFQITLNPDWDVITNTPY
ncbi:MAG: hypothetical protein JWR38_3723 [Mucilaginibacter sp.]|nr:hypothetical protein [Mucilaginibacter sp.]